MKLSPRAQQFLARQQEIYLRSLPDKKARLEKTWNAIKREGWETELAETLQMEIHRLSGSAGSYGFNSLGKAAQRLDLMMADSSFFKNPGAEFDAKFGGLMDALFVAFEEGIKGSAEGFGLEPKP